MEQTRGKSKLIEKQMEAINQTIFGTFYNIGTGKNYKQVPDSRVIQGLANKYKIKTKEVFSEQTNDYAKVVASATSPNGVYQEDIVIHNFTAILQEKTVLLAEKELKAKKEFESKPMNKEKLFKPVFFNDIDYPFELQSNGTIIPNLTLKGQIKLFKDMTRFKTFAARDAYTKAANRAQRRVLNQEFRNEVEIELEDDEVQMISDSNISKETIQYLRDGNNQKKLKKQNNGIFSENNKNSASEDNITFNKEDNQSVASEDNATFNREDNESVASEDNIAANLLTSIVNSLKDSKDELEVNKKNILNEARELAKKDPSFINENMFHHLRAEIKKRNIK